MNPSPALVIFDCDGVLVEARLGTAAMREYDARSSAAVGVPTCVASSGTHDRMRRTLGLTGHGYVGGLTSAEELAADGALLFDDMAALVDVLAPV